MALFDIIIPTYNNLEELQRCLVALERQTLRDFRAIICVDGSTDGTAEYLKQYSPSFSMLVIHHPDAQNHGRNPTRNLALPHITAEFLLFLDADIELRADCLQRHHDLLNKHDCVSVGDIRYTNAKENHWADYLQTRGKNKYHDGDEIPYYYLITQNTAHRAQYFIDIDGQDALITRYGGGDTEYAVRLNKTFHLPTIFNAAAIGDSEMNKTTTEALEQMEKFGATNLRYLAKKFPTEKEIFGLKVFKGITVTDRIKRLVISPMVSSFIEKSLGILPQSIRRQALHYCVAARIKKGFFSQA